jgi:hypothetical protein
MTQPMSRDAMRELKANTEEAVRVQQVKQIVQQVYQAAVQTARSKTETSYNHQVPRGPEYQYQNNIANRVNQNIVTDPFYVKNMPDILVGLQVLFPGCDVTHTLLSKGTDGKMYDISKLDDKVLPFVNRALDQSYIVIDWS